MRSRGGIDSLRLTRRPVMVSKDRWLVRLGYEAVRCVSLTGLTQLGRRAQELALSRIGQQVIQFTGFVIFTQWGWFLSQRRRATAWSYFLSVSLTNTMSGSVATGWINVSSFASHLQPDLNSVR